MNSLIGARKWNGDPDTAAEIVKMLTRWGYTATSDIRHDEWTGPDGKRHSDESPSILITYPDGREVRLVPGNWLGVISDETLDRPPIVVLREA